MLSASSKFTLAIILAAFAGSCGTPSNGPSLNVDGSPSDAPVPDSSMADATEGTPDAAEGTPDAETCVPACESLSCGPDPICGVECGPCADGYTCDSGMCVGTLQWGTPVELSRPDLDNATYADVRVDANGDAVVVWSQWDWDPEDEIIFHRRYSVSTGTWSGHSQLGVQQYGIGDPRISMGPAENAVVIWPSGSANGYIASRRYDAVTAVWSPRILLANTPGIRTYRPHVSTDAAGNAIAVWDQTGNDVWASRYDVSSDQWDAPVSMGSGTNAHVSMDQGGNAIMVWYGPSSGIWANRYDVTSASWGTPAQLDTVGGSLNFGARVSLDPAGNAIAVWSEWGAGHLWSKRYDVVTGMWGPRILIDDGDGAELSIDQNGNAIVVWQRYGSNNAWAKRYDAAAGLWGPVTAIGEPSAGEGAAPHISMDALGDAVAVFAQGNDATARTIWSNRYRVSDNSWGTAERIDGGSDGAYDARVSASANGQAIAVWRQRLGSVYSIWGNRLAPPAP